jgi:hypothetical protein
MCGKVSFGYREAVKKLSRYHNGHHSLRIDKIPKRVYYCKECKAWHLTSQKFKHIRRIK